ncbi:creatininase family protein [Caldisphaera sp.]|jgi:creatinine amidohydrolase|uniref:creatininase family protein n=1 Tax=Caldisphaera sp. TaxID=2060322 RepID=UPI003D0B863D
MGETMEYVWKLNGHKFDNIEKHIAIIPIGSVERHGDHLPLGTDAVEAQFVAEEVAKKVKGHLFPTIWYGSSIYLSKFPGTINIESNAFRLYVYNVLKEIARNGYKLIVIINGHGGNTSLLNIAAKDAAYEMNATYIIIDWWKDVGKETRQKLFTQPGHAGDDETSAMLYLEEEDVDIDKAKDYIPKWLPKVSIQSPIIENYLYPDAVLGGPTKADKEKGKQWLESVVNDIVKIIIEVNEILANKNKD